MSNQTAISGADLAAIVNEARPRRFRFWLVAGLLVAAGALGRTFWQAEAGHTAAVPAYVTENLRKGEIRLTVTATGNLEPTNEVTIGSELSGTAAEVMVDINDRVTKGQALARIDIRRLSEQIQSSRAALASARAKVSQVKATLQENQATLARLEELHRLSGGKTPSQADLVTGRAAVTRAQADLGSAEAAVLQAEADLAANEKDEIKAVLRSPIDGVVLSRSLEPGQTVAASFTAPELFIIAENLEHMKLKVAVAEADIGRVQAGQEASFTVDAWPDRVYQARVTKVAFGSAVTDNVVTYETELEVSNKDLSLRPGMTATADIEVAEAEGVLLVPNAALRFDPGSEAAAAANVPKKSFVQRLMPGPPRGMSKKGGPGMDAPPAPKKKPGEARVWVLSQGEAKPLTVKTGLSDGRFTEIRAEGLAEGTPVILRMNPTTP